MPVKFEIEIVEERDGGQMAMKIHCPPQEVSFCEKCAYEQLHQLLARFAVDINARSAEGEQHLN